MTAAWPLVVERLVDWLPSLPGWSGVPVYDGPPVTADVPLTYVTVGFVVGEDFGGSYEQTRNGENSYQGALEELGTVRCEVVATTGDVDLASMRSRVFALVDSWDAAIAADETLGVLPPSSTSSLAVDVAPIQSTGGTTQRLTVTVSYFARGL